MSEKRPETLSPEDNYRDADLPAADHEDEPGDNTDYPEVQKAGENNDTEEDPHSNGGRPVGRILTTIAAVSIGIYLTSLDVKFSLDWLNAMQSAHPGDLTYPFIATAAIISNFANLALNTNKIKTLTAEILGENLQTTAGRFGSSIVLGLLHAGMTAAEAYTTWWYLHQNFGATPTWLLEASTIGLTVLDDIFFKFAIANWKDKSHKSILPAFSEATIQWLGPATLETLEVLSFLHILTHPELQEEAIRTLKTGAIVSAGLLGAWIGIKALARFLENHGEEVGELGRELKGTPERTKALIKQIVNNIKSGYTKAMKDEQKSQATARPQKPITAEGKVKGIDLTVQARGTRGKGTEQVTIIIPNEITQQIPKGKVREFAQILSQLIKEQNIRARALNKPIIVNKLARQALKQLQQKLENKQGQLAIK